MNFQELFANLGESAMVLIPIVAIIVGLFVAWIAGRLGAFIVRRVLDSAKVDERASQSLGTKTQITKWVSGFTFWALFIVVLVWLIQLAQGFIPQLQGNDVQSPLQEVFARWFGALLEVGVTLLVAWIIASVLRFLVVRILNMTKLDEWLGENVAKNKTSNMNESIGKAVFWLVFLVFIPSVLDTLGIGQAAESVQGFIDGVYVYAANIISAVIIFVLGGLFARIVRQVVTGFLEGVGIDSLGERVGFSAAQKTQPLSTLLGTVAYVIVMVNVIGLALAALELNVLTSISEQILGSVTGAIIGVLGAVVILSVAYYVAKFVSEIVTNLLAGVGLDRLPEALGFKTTKGANLSSVVGYVVLVYIMLFAVQGTAEFLGLASIPDIVGSLIALGGNVLLGIVIFIAGVYLANVASNVVTTAGGEETSFLANIVRWAILVFVAGIALTQAGVPLAGETITIILYAVGAAFALAFGFGGRDMAAKQLDNWFMAAPAEEVEETEPKTKKSKSTKAKAKNAKK